MSCDTWIRVKVQRATSLAFVDCPHPAVAILYPDGNAYCAKHGPESSHYAYPSWAEAFESGEYAWILELDQPLPK